MVSLLLTAVLLGGVLCGVGHTGETPAFANRIRFLADYHGYVPCGDCHNNQETNLRPRVLQDEHEIPLEWADDEGAVHSVPFGERVPLAELLGQGTARGLQRERLERVGRRVDVRGYQAAMGLSLRDSIWVLTHGGGNIWCLDCHSANNRDMLILLNREPISFNESYRQCGQCHGPTLADWEAGVHGRTNGYWNASMDTSGVTQRLLCVECHNPHAPAFHGMKPLAGPVPRLENLSHPTKGAHREDPSKGKRDDMGPQPWQKPPAHGKSGQSRGRTR